MKRFAFKKIDAFTDGSSRGNPAACVCLESAAAITAEEMQRIARELKGFVNEVVYLFPEKDGFFLKYYSSECEVDFCGHGTIAMMYDRIRSSRELLMRPEVRVRVKDELLTVRNSIPGEDSVYIHAPAPRFIGTSLQPPAIAGALGVDAAAISTDFPVDLVNGGLNTLIVPVNGLAPLLELRPDQEQLRLFCLANGIDIILAWSAETAYRGHDYRTRVFAPKFGYLEDPATGSGNSAFGYHLLKNRRWDGKRLILEQSADRATPNIVRLGSTDGRVFFGGGAVVRIEGEYIL